MNYEINTALEHLEKSLKDVKSAQEQVTTVANSYSQLQVEIKQYSDTLSVISSNLSSVITSVNGFHQQGLDNLASAWENLRTQSNAIVAEVKTQLSTTANDFKSETEKASGNLASQVSKLESSVDKLSSLHTKVEEAAASISKLKEEITKLQTDLTTSQKAQDDAIASIDTNVKSVSTKLSATDTTINGIVTTLSGQNNSLSQLSQTLAAVSSSITQLGTSLQNSLVQQISTLEQNAEVKHEELKNKVSTLQTLLIVQLIISVIAIIIMFVLK